LAPLGRELGVGKLPMLGRFVFVRFAIEELRLADGWLI
jgi:hypothetical protein